MAGRPLLCHECGAPLWDDAGPPSPSPGTDAVDLACPDCGLEAAVFTLTAAPTAGTDDRAGARSDLERARRLRLDEAREVLTNGSFTAYGLSPGWTGHRWINGWASGPSTGGDVANHAEVLRSVNLVFGVPFDGDGGPTPVGAEIGTDRSSNGGDPGARRRLAARSLAFGAWQDGADLAPVQQTYRAADDPTAHWESVELEVAGRTAMIRRLTVGDRWWAIGVLDANTIVTLTVRGLSPEQCRLVEVADYTPFLTSRPLLG